MKDYTNWNKTLPKISNTLTKRYTISQARGGGVYVLIESCLSEQTHTLIHYTIPVKSVIKSSSEDTCGISQSYLKNNSV